MPTIEMKWNEPGRHLHVCEDALTVNDAVMVFCDFMAAVFRVEIDQESIEVKGGSK